MLWLLTYEHHLIIHILRHSLHILFVRNIFLALACLLWSWDIHIYSADKADDSYNKAFLLYRHHLAKMGILQVIHETNNFILYTYTTPPMLFLKLKMMWTRWEWCFNLMLNFIQTRSWKQWALKECKFNEALNIGNYTYCLSSKVNEMIIILRHDNLSIIIRFLSYLYCQKYEI